MAAFAQLSAASAAQFIVLEGATENAAVVQASPFHLQRTFTNLVGLSPKAYQDAKRMERFTASLKRGLDGGRW